MTEPCPKCGLTPEQQNAGDHVVGGMLDRERCIEDLRWHMRNAQRQLADAHSFIDNFDPPPPQVGRGSELPYTVMGRLDLFRESMRRPSPETARRMGAW